jgi:uncharacterized sulfatase
LVSLLDLPPTLLAAGAVDPVAAEMRGRPLQELVNGTAADWPQDAFIQISEDHVGRALRTARWKYEVAVPADAPWSGWTAAGSERYREACLYDLAADPHERTNLVADPAYAEVRRTLAARLRERLVEAGETDPVIEPAVHG